MGYVLRVMGKPLKDLSRSGGQVVQFMFLKEHFGGFPGGAVVESLPANAGHTGSSPGLGRSHMPRSN